MNHEPKLDIEAMRNAAEKATGLLRALANPDRLLLLCQLSLGEKSVGELEETLGIVQPTLSQQLTVLRQQELVSTRRAGKKIFYSIEDMNVRQLLNLLYSLYCEEKNDN